MRATLVTGQAQKGDLSNFIGTRRVRGEVYIPIMQLDHCNKYIIRYDNVKEHRKLGLH